MGQERVKAGGYGTTLVPLRVMARGRAITGGRLGDRVGEVESMRSGATVFGYTPLHWTVDRVGASPYHPTNSRHWRRRAGRGGLMGDGRTISEQLARYVLGTTFGDLPSSVVVKTRH